jgi:hypothetical protein
VKTGGDGIATVQTATVRSGTYAAQLAETAATGSFAYANATLPAATADLTATGDFNLKVKVSGGNDVRLFSLLDIGAAEVASIVRQNQSGHLGVMYGGKYYSTSGILALDTWATVALRVVIAGSGASTVQVRLNGSLVYQTTAASLGAAPVSMVQIGTITAGQPFTVCIDNVVLTSPSEIK